MSAVVTTTLSYFAGLQVLVDAMADVTGRIPGSNKVNDTYCSLGIGLF